MMRPDHEPRQPHPFLRPLALGARGRLPNRILPGPMEGITTGSFCTVLAQRGYVHSWITPFVRVSTAVARPARLRRRLEPYLACGLPVLAQIMGTHTQRLAETAARLVEAGAAGIDLNCACPSRTVLAHGAGGACLRHPEWIRQTLAALRGACPDVAISAKLRAGYADADEMPTILAAVAAAAPDFVVLHFRTVLEGYRPAPERIPRLQRARELLPGIPLLASGDLFTPADALDTASRCGVDGVAPARGLMRNPRLLRDIEDACGGRVPAPDSNRRRAAILRRIAVCAMSAPGQPCPGFVLELAAHMFGRSHEWFRGLAGCATAAAAIEMLGHVAGQQEDDGDDV
ncbi:MAG: tRNA-dihydrouridine synthase family protein [Lentisphaeria bacterium]|nr:tRNA-dihydrouridine synthase family protein [Lentisphaeria bacterium]